MDQNTNQNYNDEQNKEVVVVPTKSSNGFMDYIKNNKFIVLVIIIILIALIWYFCFRKPKTITGSASNNVPNATATTPVPGKVQITKTRISNSSAL